MISFTSATKSNDMWSCDMKNLYGQSKTLLHLFPLHFSKGDCTLLLSNKFVNKS